MFSHFPQSELTIVSPDGTIRSVEKGIVDSKQVTIPNKNAVILVGDEIRRKLPNGIEETFEVVDPVFHGGMHGAIPAHFQVKIRRKGSFPAGTGGYFTFNVSAPNARVNIGSHDHSQNIVADNAVFEQLKNAFQNKLPDSEACNGAHSLKQRLARWLLMMRDRSDDDALPITQDLLAEMLGVQRPTITNAAGELERAGLIERGRQQVTILDRKGLTKASCECYQVVRERTTFFLPKTYT